MGRDELIKEKKSLMAYYSLTCEELKDLIEKDYPVPVKNERFFFVSNKIKKIFDKITQLENQLSQ